MHRALVLYTSRELHPELDRAKLRGYNQDMRDEFTVHTLPKWARYDTIVSMISLYFIAMTSIGTNPVHSLPIVLMFCALFVLTVYLTHITNKDNEKREDYVLV